MVKHKRSTNATLNGGLVNDETVDDLEVDDRDESSKASKITRNDGQNDDVSTNKGDTTSVGIMEEQTNDSDSQEIPSIAVPPYQHGDITPAILRKYALFPDSALVRSHIRDDVHIQSFLELTKSSRMDVDSTVSIGFLFHIKHYKSGMSDSANEKERYRISARNSQGPTYNRMFFFGTLEGLTFVVIHVNQKSARNAVREMEQLVSDPIDKIGVGRAFVIVEPRAKKQTELRRDMLIVKSSKPFIPLNDSFISDLADIQVYVPDNSFEDRFFLIHRQKYTLSSTCLIGKGSNEIPSCSGSLCDRQTEPLTDIGCGCFVMDSKLSPYVMKTDLVKKDEDEGNDRLPFTLEEVRSLRLTKLFIKSGEPIGYRTGEERSNIELDFRPIVKQLTAIINNHGGFDIMGVVRRGEVGEESEQMQGKATTRNKTLGEPTFVPCYVYPNEFKNVLANEDFRKLRYVAPEFQN